MPTIEQMMGGVFAAGATLANAAFSVVGMTLMLSGTPLANTHWISGLSGLFAGSVESEIFYQNIKNAFFYSLLENGLKKKIAESMIIEKINQATDTDNEFLLAYRRNYLVLQHLKAFYHHEFDKIRTLENNLSQANEAVFNYLEDKDSDLFDDIFNTDHKATFLSIYHWKINCIRAAKFLTVSAMVGSFFCTLSVSQTALLMVGVSASSALTGGSIIAAVAAVGFGLIIYCTFMQMIYDDLFQKYWKSIVKFHKNANWKQKSCLYFSGLLFIALTISLTLATAGTWWKTGIHGQLLLIQTANIIIKSIIDFGIIVYIITSALFTLKNVAETVEMMAKCKCSALSKKLNKTWQDHFLKPRDHFFNDEESLVSHTTHYALKIPAFLLALFAYTLSTTINSVFLLWTGIALIGHCISEGVTIDNAFLIPTDVSGGISSLTEGLRDSHYLFEQNDHETLKKEEAELGQQLSPSQPNEINQAPAGDHQHSNIPNKIMFIALSPILILNAGLYCILTQKKFGKIFWKHWQSHTHHEFDEKLMPTKERAQSLFREPKQQLNLENLEFNYK